MVQDPDCNVFISHIDWHLKMYVFEPRYSHSMILTDFDSDRGLAVVFAEDIPHVAKENPVPGMVVCLFGSMMINLKFAEEWENLCPKYDQIAPSNP
jgi:hypothetical protein